MLVIYAIYVNVALFVLVLLPFFCNYFSNFGAKVVAMTRRAGSTTKRARSSSISAKPQVSLPKDLNILKHFVTQVAGSGNLDLVGAMKVEDAKVTKLSKLFFLLQFPDPGDRLRRLQEDVFPRVSRLLQAVLVLVQEAFL